LTGCWDSKEPEDLAVILVAGYDYNPVKDMYKLIVQIESSQAMKEGVGGGNKPSFWTVSAWGHTPLDALANIRKKVSRELYYAHLHLLIISEKLVKTEGIVTVMDVLARSIQSRPIVEIAVSKGNVEKILTADFPIESTNGFGIINQINITQEELGTAIVQKGRKFLNKLSTPGIEPVAITLEFLKKENKNNSKSQPDTKPDSPPEVKISGLTAFKQDKMTGRLNDREARGWNWISDQPVNGIINFTYPGNKNIKVTVITHRVSSKITPIFKNGKPKIKINVEVIGKLTSITGLSNFKESSEITQSFHKRLAGCIINVVKKKMLI
jgi:spore germination protein KC